MIALQLTHNRDTETKQTFACRRHDVVSGLLSLETNNQLPKFKNATELLLSLVVLFLMEIIINDIFCK